MTSTGRKVGSRDRQNKKVKTYIIKRKRHRQKEWRKKQSKNQRKQKKNGFVNVYPRWEGGGM